MIDFTTMLGGYSTNNGVATVNDAGLVTAVGEDYAKIVAVDLMGPLISTPVPIELTVR